MPRTNISFLPPRAIALTVLSKLLYALADKSGASDEVTTYHRKILADTIADDDLQERTQICDSFSIRDIPWLELLDQIASHIVRLQNISATNNFTRQEIRYMTAMACGLTGKEYGLITGFKSHYSTAVKSDWLGAQEITTKNVILTWATTQEKITVRISRPR